MTTERSPRRGNFGGSRRPGAPTGTKKYAGFTRYGGDGPVSRPVSPGAPLKRFGGSRPARPAGARSPFASGTRPSSGGGAGRPSFSGPRPGGFSRGPARSFGNRGGGGGRKMRGDFIDENKFINKAVAVEQEEKYEPTHTFSDFNVDPTLAKNLARKEFVYPSPIQDQAIPVALKGCDVIGIAATGTGKTAAFLIPIINAIVADRGNKAMVLTPTRELAQQVETEFRSLAWGMRLWSVAVVGGLPISKQIRALDTGVDVVIGTPGRVKDLIERGKIKMSEFKTIVLDEADRMLDMGFIDDMRKILGGLPTPHQSMFFSATFSSEIRHLCNDFLTNPVTISLKTRDTSASVDQDVVRVGHHSEKLDKLHEILNQPEVKKVLIFRETKRHTDELARELRGRGFKVSPLHGDMRSRERSRAVESLSKGDIQAVIATDVAARGIDIPDVTHVINYDVPSTYDTYIHRIGRTGRGNKKGIALTFVK